MSAPPRRSRPPKRRSSPARRKLQAPDRRPARKSARAQGTRHLPYSAVRTDRTSGPAESRGEVYSGMALPSVFTIPASVPFVPTLIRALIEGTLVPGFPVARDPLALARATLYLPTRRACRLARDLFLDVTEGSAAILPRIVAIGDVDEDEIAFAQAATGALAADALDLPPALGGLERRHAADATRAPMGRGIAPDGQGEAPLVANNPASALALADDLARLIDDMTTRGVSWDRLDELVPETLDRYWQLTLEIPEDRARDLAENPRRARRHRAGCPARRADQGGSGAACAHADGPVIAAGSTGSMPATAELIATIAKLPHGAVVLPGLDTHLDAAVLGADRRPARGRRSRARYACGRASAIRHAGAAAPHRHRARGGPRSRHTCGAWARTLRLGGAAARGCHRPLAAARCFRFPDRRSRARSKRCRSSKPPMRAKKRLPSPSRCAKRSRRRARPQPWSPPTAPWRAACSPRSNAGRSRSMIPAATRSPTRRPELFARLAVEVALGGLRARRPARLAQASARCDLAARQARMRARPRRWRRRVLRGPRPQPGTAGLAHALSVFRTELAKLRRGEPSDLHRSDPRADLSEGELDAAARPRRAG